MVSACGETTPYLLCFPSLSLSLIFTHLFVSSHAYIYQASELCLDDTHSSTHRTSFRVYSKTRRHISYIVDTRSSTKRTEWMNTINDLTRRMTQQFPQDLEEEYGRFVSLYNNVPSTYGMYKCTCMLCVMCMQASWQKLSLREI